MRTRYHLFDHMIDFCAMIGRHLSYPCFADNQAAGLKVIGFIILMALAVLLAMVVFIALALVLRHRAKARKTFGAMSLAIGAGVLVILWYAVMFAVIIVDLTSTPSPNSVSASDVLFVFLAFLGLGLPAHIPAGFVVLWAVRLYHETVP